MKENYPTFKTRCNQCEKFLTVTQFTVHAGKYSFALCAKHLKELLKKYQRISTPLLK